MSIDLATLSRGAVWLRAKDTTGPSVSTWVDRLGLHNAVSQNNYPDVIEGATILGGKALRFYGYSAFDLGRVLDDTPVAVATASSSYGSSYSPDKALDGPEGGESWASAYEEPFPHWWKITFSSPKTLTKYAIHNSSASTWNIKSWELQGSNDNFDTYYVLDTQSGVTWPDTYADFSYEYSFTNTTAYIAYRIYITESNSLGDTMSSIGEFTCGETILGDVDTVSNNFEAWIVVKGNGIPFQANGLWRWSDAYSYTAYPNSSGNSSYYIYEQFCSSGYTYSYHYPGSGKKEIDQFWRVYRVTYDNGTLKMYLDGVNEATAYVGTRSLTNHVILGRSQFGLYESHFFRGDIAEVYARNKVSSPETAQRILDYLQGEHIFATVTGEAPVRIKSRYNVGVISELTGSAPVNVSSSDHSIQASTTSGIAPVDVKSISQSIAELLGYPGEDSEILIPMELSGAIDPLLPPPTPPIDFEGISDPTVAPTLSDSNTATGALQPLHTYRYSYAAWKGSPSQATAPSPTADITLAGSADTVTLTYPTIEGADGYLVYREDL